MLILRDTAGINGVGMGFPPREAGLEALARPKRAVGFPHTPYRRLRFSQQPEAKDEVMDHVF